MSSNLLPDVATPSVKDGLVMKVNEAELAEAQPRVNAEGDFTISGTVSEDDEVVISFSSELFGSIAFEYEVLDGDTVGDIALALANAIAGNEVLRGFGLQAIKGDAGKIDFLWPGPLSGFVVIAADTDGEASVDVSQFDGGAGPIIPQKDFAFIHNGAVIQLRHGRRLMIDPEALQALVTGSAGDPPAII